MKTVIETLYIEHWGTTALILSDYSFVIKLFDNQFRSEHEFFSDPIVEQMNDEFKTKRRELFNNVRDHINKYYKP